MKISQADFKTYHQHSSQAIQNELVRFTNDWNIYIETKFPELKQINHHFTQSLFGGKMLRGTLVQLGYTLIKQYQTKNLMQPAAACELLHTALLIHDDIIDQSPIRRGKPAIHSIHKDKHYGISQAICIGDLGIIQATKLLAESNFPIENKQRALTYFLKVISDTILGEMLDVSSSRVLQRTEAQITTIQTMKTARYTIVGPLVVGALLAGASNKLIQTIEQFGEHLGIAFQIHDDILGVFGDEKTTGKSATSDIEENKSTLLLTYSLQHGNKQQLSLLSKYYGKKGLSTMQHEAIKNVFITTGAFTYSQQSAKEHIEKAKALIMLLSKKKEKQQLLMQLADEIIKRIK